MATSVILDFDGTIADSFDYVFNFLWKAAGRGELPPAEELTQYRHMTMTAMGRKMGIPWWRLGLLYFIGTRQMRRHLEIVLPFAGVIAEMEKLQAAGCRLYVVSANNRRTIRHFIRVNKLEGMFAAIYAGAAPFGKQRMLRRLLQRQRINPASCWMVADLASDARAARAVGIRPLSVAWGFDDRHSLEAVSDVVVDEPAEISRVILAAG